MNPYQRIDGGVIFSAREYDIAAETAVKEGQVVVLQEGLVVPAAAAVTGKILGIAAENHSGQADALDPRANGEIIKVWDDPGQVLRCKAPIVEVTAATATSVPANGIAAFAEDAFNGGYLMLVAKAEGSANTDAIGTCKRVKDYAGKVFTVAAGATAGVGDKYAVFPPVGFRGGNLDAELCGLVLTATAELPVKVIGRIEDSGDILLMPVLHELGQEN